MANGNGSAQGHEQGIGGGMVTRTSDRDGAIIERVIALGDLSQLKPMERAAYYTAVCRSCGLNPMTKPFAYIQLNGKLTLYALRDATDQLRKIHRISVRILSRELDADGVYTVTARAVEPSGREDESTGCVSLGGAKGENLANAKMKAETKAKRRVTLSICGLGWLDETEVEDVRAARFVHVNDSGEIVEPPSTPALPPAQPEDAWLEWAMTHTAAMNEAKTPGALKAAYAKAYREAESRGAPQHIRESLEKTKDALKGKMEVG